MATTQSFGDDDNIPSRTKNSGDVANRKCDGISDAAIMHMEFGSWEAVGVFYNAYAKQGGFSISETGCSKITMVKCEWSNGTHHIVGLCKEQHNGFRKMGFTPKDVENVVQGLRRNMIQGGDANTTLGYLAERLI
ncbi:hypothetical protein LINPERHAP1_LOCUS18001 [Linum perenne]